MKKFNSEDYWETRYAKGGNSGSGSYGKLAEFKAEVINQFVKEHDVQSVIEFGCGDGNQLKMYDIPKYVGIDVSLAILMKLVFEYEDDNSKSFYHTSITPAGMNAELTMSIDVLFHITEESEFLAYLKRLFNSSSKYVIIYAYDYDTVPEDKFQAHYQPRKFTGIIEEMFPQWKLIHYIPNRYPVLKFGTAKGSYSEFYIYEKSSK